MKSLSEKQLLAEIIYDWEATIVWNFTEIEKEKSKLALSQKIQPIKYLVWQVPFLDSISLIIGHQRYIRRGADNLKYRTLS